MFSGRGKSRTKLEQLFRQDHSDVYFNNDRLNDDLVSRIEYMEKEMHKHDQLRGVEIFKLRQEMKEGRLLQLGHQEGDETDGRRVRPHTAAGNASRIKSASSSGKKRAKSAWARTQADDKVGTSENKQTERIERSSSPTSSVSTLQNTKTLKRYRDITPNRFKENGRFPAEWYIRCIPASDTAVHNARMRTRGKSAPSPFNFLAKIREQEMTERKLKEYTQVKLTTNGENAASNMNQTGEGLSLMCEDTVKPILMSRRRLMQIANEKTFVDRGPSRNTMRHSEFINKNNEEVNTISKKVQDFCAKLEDFKANEIIELKEREEARKREREEQEYQRAIDEAKRREADAEKRKADVEDDKWENKWR
ncbi:uncharacterized protein LOC127851511 [Dreissena polymorpha]|uniref:Uncharacterized protein n=1 Tax=Dreissena polymorpha TaxID=45954 RepID=A0A9D4D4C2_DREPO|nr:uncharacterized protein LOC127851511 [Dreissena polymorpha]XP_052241280.1 uncharacterized protein LOC127851511 [Dreissena polymorpha]KAH3737795.1 hypothetical protein DPMN_044390 [Dreissena polymorpha]